MAREVSARVEWQEKMRFVGRASGEQAVVIDYPPPAGDDMGIRGGLELLLMSLAACTGQGVAWILRQMHQPVVEITVEARGQRRDEHPTILTDIELKFRFTGRGLDHASVQRAVNMAENQYCPVWAMLKGGTTRITALVEIVEIVETVAGDVPEAANQPA